MNEKLVRECLRMFKDRERFWNKKDGSIGCIYESVVDMLNLAINGEEDLLRNYDYYTEE